MRRIEVRGALERPKGMKKPLIQPTLGLKGGLPFIFFLHPNLAISTSKINLRENFRPIKLIKHIIQSGNKKSTLNSNVVYDLRINTHSQVPPFLGIKRAVTEHGLKLSLMYPRSSNSWTCHCSSFDLL